MVSVFDYSDYRAFLKDIYAEKKATHKYFSYRYVADKSGLRSPGFFTWILQGKRNLSQRLILRYCDIFELNKKESSYFELLVNYNQAKTHEEKKYYFDKIAMMTHSTGGKVVNPQQYKFYDKWFYQAIWASLNCIPFRGDFNRLSKSLVPKISVSEAREAIKVLRDLGMIEKDSQGRFRQVDASLTTGEHWRSMAINNYQSVSLDLAKNALNNIPKEIRDISTVTGSCSLKTFQNIQDLLQKVRREIADLMEKDMEPEVVYQSNFQLFPLTQYSMIKDEEVQKLKEVRKVSNVQP